MTDFGRSLPPMRQPSPPPEPDADWFAGLEEGHKAAAAFDAEHARKMTQEDYLDALCTRLDRGSAGVDGMEASRQIEMLRADLRKLNMAYAALSRDLYGMVFDDAMDKEPCTDPQTVLGRQP